MNAMIWANKNRAMLVMAAGVLLLALAGLVACTNNTAEVACNTVCTDPTLQPFYEQNGGFALFGEPHTPLFEDPVSGRMVQYFDNVRLEYAPDQPDQIAIYPLGAWALEGLDEPTAAAVPASGRIRSFGTGFTVQDQFLLFYEANNGELLFGQPLTPQIEEADRRVQYFENVRLQWHPEAPPNRQIQVAELGRAHYSYEVYDPIASVFMPDDRVRATSAEVTAAVSSPVLYSGDQQILYVIAEGTDGQPIPGLQAQLQISQGQLTITQELEGETDLLGTLQSTLDLPELTPGEEVRLTISVGYPGEANPIGKVIITFKPWW